MKNITSLKKQSGLSLIEALVALVVLALGVMGLAGVQTRLLVETRTSNSRATAIGLIDDLSNRMLLNRVAAVGQPSSAYTLAWSSAPPTTPPSNQVDCSVGAVVCTAAQLALSDLFAWRTAVAAAFPGSQATVFNSPTDQRQIGIAIGWPANERKLGNTAAPTADDTLAAAPFAVTLNTNGTNCPMSLICHVVYVQP
jgi:type IV pilus assembly protein PilV